MAKSSSAVIADIKAKQKKHKEMIKAMNTGPAERMAKAAQQAQDLKKK